MLGDRDEVVRVGLSHRDPVKEAALTQTLVMTPVGQGIRGQRGLLNLVKAGRSVLWADVTRQSLERQAFRADQIEFILSVGVSSCAIVPLVLRDRVIGAFAWIRHAGRPKFDDRDLALAAADRRGFLQFPQGADHVAVLHA